eukprot:943472-Pleurochrysis_carterae.AAC.3
MRGRLCSTSGRTLSTFRARSHFPRFHGAFPRFIPALSRHFALSHVPRAFLLLVSCDRTVELLPLLAQLLNAADELVVVVLQRAWTGRNRKTRAALD